MKFVFNNIIINITLLYNLLLLCYSKQLYINTQFTLSEIENCDNDKKCNTIPIIPCQSISDCPDYSYRCREFKNVSFCDFTLYCTKQSGCIAINKQIDDNFYETDGLYINSNVTNNSSTNESNFLYIFTNEKEFKDKKCEINTECFSNLCEEGKCIGNDKDPIKIFELSSDKNNTPFLKSGKSIKESCKENIDCITNFCKEKKCEIKDSNINAIILVIELTLLSNGLICLCITCYNCCKKKSHYYS